MEAFSPNRANVTRAKGPLEETKFKKKLPSTEPLIELPFFSVQVSSKSGNVSKRLIF